MTLAGFTSSMSRIQWRRLHGARGHELPLLQITGNGGGAPDPMPGICPSTKLRDFRPPDPLTPHHHRGAVPQTVGPEPQGTGRVPPLIQIAGHV